MSWVRVIGGCWELLEHVAHPGSNLANTGQDLRGRAQGCPDPFQQHGGAPKATPMCPSTGLVPLSAFEVSTNSPEVPERVPEVILSDPYEVAECRLDRPEAVDDLVPVARLPVAAPG